MEVLISRKGSRYLREKFSEAGIDYDEDEVKKKVIDTLYPYGDNIPESMKIKIMDGDEIGASNGSFFGRKQIFLNGRYIFDLFASEDKELSAKLLIQCIGHELGHDKAFTRFPFMWIFKEVFSGLATKRDTLRAHLVEAYCDYYSSLFSGFDKEEVCEVMGEHQNRKKEYHKDYKHPSWPERISYIKSGFSPELIKKIAIDVGCDNEKEIENLIAYYDKVKDDNGYVKKSDLVISYIRIILPIVLFILLVVFLDFITWA